MGWGPNPIDQQAAAEATAKAREALESRPLTPFERKLIAVLDDIREELTLARPVALEPIIGNDCGLGPVSVERNGIIGTGANEADANAAIDDYLARMSALLDADPADLTLAIDAGATAMQNSFPTLREDFTRAGFEKFAECVIEAALMQAAQIAAAQSSRGPEAATDEAAGGGVGGEGATRSVTPPAVTLKARDIESGYDPDGQIP